MSKQQKKKENSPKSRNWIAVTAFQKSGAGNHGDKKKQTNKNLCRKPIKNIKED